MSDKKKILCLDFDGVLHSYTSGWQGIGNISDPPVDGAKEFLERAVEHFDVHIFSSRSREPFGITAMVAYCTQYFSTVIDKLSFPTIKPAAFVSIDDRTITFTGTFPDIEELENFKPWNGREP